MRSVNPIFTGLARSFVLLAGCSRQKTASTSPSSSAQPEVPIFHIDPATAGTIDGKIRFTGARPAAKPIDMSDDPACVAAHHGKPHDDSLIVGSKGGLANVFLFIEKGLEGKRFEVPASPVVINQTGCWFVPRVLGIQVNQPLQVLNSDPVTHNIHPMAVVNREWNHSQGAGDPPIERHFTQPEIMIPIKCNIHSWMHAFIGVVSSPYFAFSDSAGQFKIPNLPPGTYTIAAWHEKFGVQRQTITIAPSGTAHVSFNFHE